MNTAYLLTGGNLGNRNDNLAIAKKLIAGSCGDISRASAVYETAAWGPVKQPDYLNQVLELHTEMNAAELMKQLLRIEKKMGRVRKVKSGPRNIDIDILLFNDENHNLRSLKIPHPELPNRRFALIPLSELIPDMVHPVLKKTIRTLLATCEDKLNVKKYSS